MSETPGERIVRLETRMDGIEADIGRVHDSQKQRSGREWAIIMTGLGLLGTIVIKQMGWVQ